MLNRENMVSVVIPAKDRLIELGRTLNSVLQQTYENFEVIIVENNSIDKESMELLVFNYGDKRLKFFSLDRCDNANVARNKGAELARGEFIAFLDSDDTWMPNHLEENYNFIINNRCDFLYSGTRINNGYDTKIMRSRDLLEHESPADFLIGFNRSYAQTSSYFMTKQAFMKLSWDESLNRCQDLDFFIRASQTLNCRCLGEITTIVNWEDGRNITYNLKSMSYFYRKYISIMKKTTAVRYYLIIIRTNFEMRNLSYIFTNLLVLISRVIKRC